MRTDELVMHKRLCALTVLTCTCSSVPTHTYIKPFYITLLKEMQFSKVKASTEDLNDAYVTLNTEFG